MDRLIERFLIPAHRNVVLIHYWLHTTTCNQKNTLKLQLGQEGSKQVPIMFSMGLFFVVVFLCFFFCPWAVNTKFLFQVLKPQLTSGIHTRNTNREEHKSVWKLSSTYMNLLLNISFKSIVLLVNSSITASTACTYKGLAYLFLSLRLFTWVKDLPEILKHGKGGNKAEKLSLWP